MYNNIVHICLIYNVRFISIVQYKFIINQISYELYCCGQFLLVFIRLYH